MSTTIAIFGAAGSMGTRACNRLGEVKEYNLLYVEGTDAGEAKLRERGLSSTPGEKAAKTADVCLLALPDKLIRHIAPDIVNNMKPGAMIITLDPAAPHAGVIPKRGDISIFVTHPAHPPIFNDETEWDARRDYFGSGQAKQAIVSALMNGPEENFAKGETISKHMFSPILRSHRVTVEQMAVLEPVLSETVAATCLTIVREAMDKAIALGVPEQAARDFLMGHLNIEIAILFNEINWNFSDGAKKAIEEAKKDIFQADWQKVFEPERLKESVEKITGVR